MEQWAELRRSNPLWFYEAAGHKHHQFHLAYAPRTIRFLSGGNRAGKTTTGVNDSLIQMVPGELLAPHLAPYKHHDCATDGPYRLRVVVPDLEQTGTPIHEKFKQWTPRQLFIKGEHRHSWRASEHKLHLDCGCFMELLSTSMDVDKHGGAARHRVHFDEEPPQEYFTENAMRIADYGGDLLFTMTPLQGLSWTYREIWKQRHTELVAAFTIGMRHNKYLAPQDIEFVLSLVTNDQERRQREHGEFAERGGPVYPNFLEALCRHPSQDFLKHKDVVICLDPGLNNAGLVWIAFDRYNRAVVFACANLRRNDVAGYVHRIAQVNRAWGITDYELVVDPASSAGNLVDGRSVIDALVERGEHPVPANNSVEAGVLEVRERLGSGALKISELLTGLHDEAVEYAQEERDDGTFKPKKNGREHRLDALRYGCMHRPRLPSDEVELVQGVDVATGPPRPEPLASVMGAMA
jgi:phage terminase large subunit-like protein